MISFAGSNSTSDLSSRFTAMGINSGLPIVVAGDYSREAIFLKCFRRRGDIIPGRPLMEGRLI